MPQSLFYLDLDGELEPTTWDAVLAATRRIQAFFHAVELRFVEREDVIRKIMFAMMMREHVLIDGPTGTGKSFLLDTIFDNIEGGVTWSMDLTRYTSNTDLFGNYCVRTMRERGHTVHLTEGSLAEANFAKTGEFFDANDAALRTLLGVLNERRMRRGPQLIKFPLLTVVADTNFRLDDQPQRRTQLAAVIDRFLFQTSVEYVQDPTNRYHMLETSLEARHHKASLPPLSKSDVELVSGTVRAMDMVQDRYVRQAYEEMHRLFKEARIAEGRAEPSDRRFIRAAQVMEVSALLHGRQTCTFEDLAYTKTVLVEHRDDQPLFEQALHDAVTAWTERAASRVIDKELHTLGEIIQRLPTADLATMGHAQVKPFVAKLETVLEELKTFKPSSIEARDQYTKTMTRIHEQLAQADLRMIELLVSRLPDVQNVDPSTLKVIYDHVKHIDVELLEIDPKSEAAIIAHAMAMNRVAQTLADIEVEFTGKKAI